MRGRLILASLLVGSSVATAAACVTYSEEDGPLSPDASPSAEAAPDTDASDAAVAPPIDAADAADAADAVDPCDKDNDGYLATACDGGDCDDTDPRAHPDTDAGFSTAVISSVTSGDWNCDGVVTKQLSYGVTCSMASAGIPCETVSGFIGNPACGQKGDYVTCKAGSLALSCAVGSTTTKTQGCR